MEEVCMIYLNITKIYNNKIALLKRDVSKNNDLTGDILIDISLLEHFKRRYSYKYLDRKSVV